MLHLLSCFSEIIAASNRLALNSDCIIHILLQQLYIRIYRLAIVGYFNHSCSLQTTPHINKYEKCPADKQTLLSYLVAHVSDLIV